ncbi:hypothetical protein CRUP_006883 [Coryphaenoides rupestris]|nr:hypothetical protein CRUP_006883 [Coryphaenoides rupestris]
MGVEVGVEVGRLGGGGEDNSQATTVVVEEMVVVEEVVVVEVLVVEVVDVMVVESVNTHHHGSGEFSCVGPQLTPPPPGINTAQHIMCTFPRREARTPGQQRLSVHRGSPSPWSLEPGTATPGPDGDRARGGCRLIYRLSSAPRGAVSQQSSTFSGVVNRWGHRGARQERLPVKYLKTRHKKPSLDISRWRFLSDILDHEDEDDDADPARPGASRGGIQPVDLSSSSTAKVRTAVRARRAMSKEQACFSRQNAAQQTRRERVAAVERKLLCHPLALYGHYEQHMPPELFQQVLSVLDPDIGPGVQSRPGADEPESVALRDSEVRDGEDISNMTQRFLDWDASLRKAGCKRPDARYQDPRTRVGAVAETRQNQEGCPEQRFHLQQHQASNKEECRQMFAFQAFMQYLVSNRLRVPEFMSDIFSGEDEGAAETRGTAGARPGLTWAPKRHGADV